MHQFEIQEFRRPEYEVSSTIQSATTYYCHPTIDQYVIATCQGKLFAGGFLSDASVRWTIRAESTKFTPANRSDYTFGRAESMFFWFRNNDENKISYPTKYFEVIEFH